MLPSKTLHTTAMHIADLQGMPAVTTYACCQSLALCGEMVAWQCLTSRAAVAHHSSNHAALATSAFPGAVTSSFFGASGSQTCAHMHNDEHEIVKQHQSYQAVDNSRRLARRQRHSVPCMLGGSTLTCRSDLTAVATDMNLIRCDQKSSGVQPCTCINHVNGDAGVCVAAHLALADCCPLLTPAAVHSPTPLHSVATSSGRQAAIIRCSTD